MGWTTTDLLTVIRERGRIPSGDPDYTDAALLRRADWQMSELFVPIVLSVREEFYNTTQKTSLEGGRQEYPFPSRAFASSLRDVLYIDSNDDQRWMLTPLPHADRHEYRTATGRPGSYTVEDDKIVLLPEPSSNVSGSLEIYYEYRPGALVSTSEAMQITAVSGGVLSGNAPTAWSTADNFNIVKGAPPFALVSADLTASAVSSGASVEFSTDDIDTDRVKVGDWVALEGESPIPQIPANMHSLLGLSVATDVAFELDYPDAKAFIARLDEGMKRARGAITPRVKGRVEKLVSRNSSTRHGRYRRRGWFDDL